MELGVVQLGHGIKPLLKVLHLNQKLYLFWVFEDCIHSYNCSASHENLLNLLGSAVSLKQIGNMRCLRWSINRKSFPLLVSEGLLISNKDLSIDVITDVLLFWKADLQLFSKKPLIVEIIERCSGIILSGVLDQATSSLLLI